MFGGEICIYTYPSDEYSQAIGRLKQSWKPFMGVVLDKHFMATVLLMLKKKKLYSKKNLEKEKKKSKAVLLKESGKINHTRKPRKQSQNTMDSHGGRYLIRFAQCKLLFFFSLQTEK